MANLNSRLRQAVHKRRLRNLELRGLEIVALGGMITRVNDALYLVRHEIKNSARSGIHKVKWTKGVWKCNCLYHVQTKCVCQHIFGVDFLLRLPQIVMSNSGALTGESRCTNCGSENLGPYGSRYNQSGSVRRFICRSCGKTFKDPSMRHDLSSKIALVIIVLDLFYKKLSYREIQHHLY
ncbi:MAG: hypothetical protein ACREBU_22135, partial [Nitrososphaera sp.]